MEKTRSQRPSSRFINTHIHTHTIFNLSLNLNGLFPESQSRSFTEPPRQVPNRRRRRRVRHSRTQRLGRRSQMDRGASPWLLRSHPPQKRLRQILNGVKQTVSPRSNRKKSPADQSEPSRLVSRLGTHQRRCFGQAQDTLRSLPSR